jgi:hypothetical protein
MFRTKPAASTIMIIRHAEKPPEPPSAPPPFGVAPDGTSDARSLTVRGWQRAGALVNLFVPTRPRPSSIRTPQFIYAVKVDGDDEKPRDASGTRIGTKGRRSQQTIAPIAEKLRSAATLNFTFDKGDEAAMIASAMACPGVVLICWVHENIPRIGSGMQVNSATPVPETWPTDAQGGSRFDVVWLFELDDATGAYRFSQVPQELLAGDLPE